MSKNQIGIYERSFAILLEAVANISEIEKAAVFGSRAMGNYKKGSDIDLVLYGSGITPGTVLKLSATLNQQSIIPYKIDVLHYEQIENDELKNSIDDYGVMIYNKQHPGKAN